MWILKGNVTTGSTCCLLVGKTGSGKSTVGNIILGRNSFPIGKLMTGPTTLNFQSDEATLSGGDKVKIVDTPDITQHCIEPRDLDQWKSVVSPELHAVLWVVRCDVPYTQSDALFYEELKRLWGEEFLCSRLIFLFTVSDQSITEVTNSQLTPAIGEANHKLRQALSDAGNRMIVFNIANEKGCKNKVKELLAMIKSLKTGSSQCRETFSSRPTFTSRPTFSSGGQGVSLLLIGKTGNGKSSAGNSILQRHVFRVGTGMSSTTIKPEKQSVDLEGRRITVVDTQDITDLDLDDNSAKREIRKWKEMTSSGPSAVLLAVRCDKRYTAEEHEIYLRLKKLWGEVVGDNAFRDRLVIVFTFGDTLDRDIRTEVKKAPFELTSILKDAHENYIVLNGKAKLSETVTRELLNIVDRLG